MTRDAIYDDARQLVDDFVFDEHVAAVFNDMIDRSVPGYRTTVSTIAGLARDHVPPKGRVYDLGSSLGAVSLGVAHALADKDAGDIISVDMARAMLARWSEASRRAPWPIEQRCEDVITTAIEAADLVVLNYTLQFIEPANREAVIANVARGLRPGGLLVLSEKICDADPVIDAQLVKLHHEFKRLRGYSDLAISQKRTALEGVLIPETVAAHEARLLRCGFSRVSVWYRCFNFVSWLAWA